MKLGTDTEDSARQKYALLMSSGHGNDQVDIDDETNPGYVVKHVNFACRKSGLQLHEKYQFLAATPDGVTSCDCCGLGILEIKTLAKYFDDGLPFNIPTSVCLDNELKLKINHPFYTQCQFQLMVTNANFCDFVCVTKFEVYIQRILPDLEFINTLKKQCIDFFKLNIIKQILTRSLDPILQ